MFCGRFQTVFHRYLHQASWEPTRWLVPSDATGLHGHWSRLRRAIGGVGVRQMGSLRPLGNGLGVLGVSVFTFAVQLESLASVGD